MRKKQASHEFEQQESHTVPKVVVDMCDIFLFGESGPAPDRDAGRGPFDRGAGRRPKRRRRAHRLAP